MKNYIYFRLVLIIPILILNSFYIRAQTAPNLGINNQFAVLAGGKLTDNNVFSVKGYLGASILTGTNYNADTAFVNTDETIEAISTLGNAITNLSEQSGEETEDIDNDAIINQGIYHFSSNLTILENSVFTLSGTEEDIIIFNIDGNLTIEAGVNIILDGIKSENVYWNIKNNLTIFNNCIVNGTFLVSDNALVKSSVFGNISILSLDDVEINNGTEYLARSLYESDNLLTPTCPNCIGTNLVEHGDFPYKTAGTFPGTNNFTSTFIFNSLTTTHSSNTQGVYTIGHSTLDYNNVGFWGNVVEHTGNISSNFMMVDGAHQGISNSSKTVWKQQYISVTSASMFRFSAAIVSLYQAPTGLEHRTKLEFVVNNEVVGIAILPYNNNWDTYCFNWIKPIGVTSVNLEIRQVQNNPDFLGTDYGIDDITFAAIDIPNSDFSRNVDFCIPNNDHTELEATFHGMGDDENMYIWEILNGETYASIGGYRFNRQFAGTYTISLTVTNPCGGSSTTTKTLFLPTRSTTFNYNCCLQTMSYDIINDVDLKATESNWTSERSINATIYIKPKNTLYITGTTISFGLKGKIVIEQGA